MDILIENRPQDFPSEQPSIVYEKRSFGEKERKDMLIRESYIRDEESQYSHNATEGEDKNNLWRLHPSLSILKKELVDLKNNPAAQHASL